MYSDTPCGMASAATTQSEHAGRGNGDVDIVMAAGSRLGGTAAPSVHLVGADCVIDVVGRSVDDHVAALPARQRRTNFRREEKRFIDSGLTDGVMN